MRPYSLILRVLRKLCVLCANSVLWLEHLILQIVTPEREIFNAAVQQVSLPGMAGSFGVMRNHAPIVAALEPGALDIRDADNGELHLSIGGGFFQMMDNQAIVLADSAENASDINVERAREAEKRAKRVWQGSWNRSR